MKSGNDDCRAFRRRLERALDARVDSSLTELGWHEHLVACAACRGLLEAEEALEVLLASLPEPQLPLDLARRVIASLRRDLEGERLDRLLELDATGAVPANLAARVLAGVQAESDRRFERLLELGGEVEVPGGLERRVLAGVRAARESELVSAGGRGGRLLRLPRRALLAAAGVVLVTAAGIFLARSSAFEEEPPEGLLAALDVLEHWESITAPQDLDLTTGIDFDPADEALLDFIDR